MSRLRSRSWVVLLVLVTAGLQFGAAALPWVAVSVPTAVQVLDITARGSDAAPAVTALALVAAAASIALSLAGRRVRWVISGLIIAAAAGSILAIAAMLRDPVRAAESQVGEAAGVVGTGAEHHVTAWPWVCLAMAALLLLSGIWAGLVSRDWASRSSSKYTRTAPDPRAARHGDDIDAWDALTRGDDPTGA